MPIYVDNNTLFFNFLYFLIMSTLKYWLLVTLNEIIIVMAAILIIVSIYTIFNKNK